jgi:glycogen synthase
MKILMYGWEFPPHISGGLGVACFGLTQALGEQGHQVTFVVPRMERGGGRLTNVDLIGSNDFPIKEDDQNTSECRWLSEYLRLETVDSALRPYITDTEYRQVAEWIEKKRVEYQRGDAGFGVEISGNYGPNLMAEVARYARVAGAIAGRVEHDIIHAHDWLTMLAGLAAKKVSGRPLVVHVHALEFDRSGEAVNRAVYEIERLGMAKADRVVAVSQLTKQTIINRYGIDAKKVEIVYNAVANHPRRASGSRVARRDKVVLFLGRITFQKGPEYFVEAAARILKHRDDVRFVMAGSGDMAPRVIRRVAELKIGKRFHFTGFLTGSAVDRMYEESDVYVMPSVSEPFGIAPLEAMRFDVPVIISKQSGVAEVLRHALKVDFWDVDDLADKINSLLDHRPLHRELVRQGARELETIKWSRAVERLRDVYRGLIA